MFVLKKLLSLAVMAFPASMFLLAACTAVVETGPSRPPQMCTMEHAPVCAQRGSLNRTFSNACLARADGFRVIHAGQCSVVGQACTREFRPVCARRGNVTQTFDNQCLARTSGFSVVHQGQCRPAASVACPMIEAPVCAQRGNRFRSFGNECMARAGGYRVVHQGRCR